MTSIRQGDVFWIAADAVRPAVSGVAHPWVVVQDDLLNASRIPTVVVVGVTSRMSRTSEPGAVMVDSGEGGLETTSVVLPSQICVVEKDALGERLGRLPQHRVARVLAGLRQVVRLQSRP